MNILKNLGQSNSPEVKKVLDELTIVAIPMMNVDGSELDRRGNEMTWSEVVGKFPQLSNVKPTWNYYTTPRSGDDYASKPGFDVNRDFNPDLNYVPKPQDFPGASEKPGWFITPEAQTVRDTYKGLKSKIRECGCFYRSSSPGVPIYRRN